MQIISHAAAPSYLHITHKASGVRRQPRLNAQHVEPVCVCMVCIRHSHVSSFLTHAATLCMIDRSNLGESISLMARIHNFCHT